MAGIARLTSGMLLGVDLRKALGLGDIFGMAADAETGDIGLLRRHAHGIFGMFCERAMAGFTVDASMHAFCLGIGNIGMAAFARLVAGVNDGPRADFRNRIAAKVAVAAKAFRHERTAEDEEKKQSDDENRGHAKEMSDVSHLNHKMGLPTSKM